MKKAFKEFWKDYWQLQKESLKWCKKHWLGYIILVLLLSVPLLVWEWYWYNHL